MSSIRIVHLSDLHFAKKEEKNPEVWEKVVKFINDDVRPDAILITGDVTDNATEEEFRYAFDMLAQLKTRHAQLGQPQYRIVPGNHDRYEFLGNNWRKFFGGKKHSYKANLFETQFKGYYPTIDSVADLNLKDDGNCWKVRVIGLDSNDLHCWFAQGSVRETDAIAAKRCALSDSDSDLVVALIHHHVLPIPAVERTATSEGKGISNIVDFTGLLNAGTLLDHLSEAQVNIVLHGHEHERNLARFSGSGLHAGTTVILAAGSGTGEKTLEGWGLERVHFNVLELESNRAVFLREAGLEKGEFSLGPRRPLLTGTAIRQSRFVRRNRKQGDANRILPTSRIKKLFLLDTDRSATIIESRTDIATKKEWSLTTACASGHIDGMAEVEFESDSGDKQLYSVPFIPSPSGDHEAFSCGLTLEGSEVVLLKRSTVRWRWASAVLLRESDVRVLPPSALTGLRSKGREFVTLGIGANEEFEEASITLGIPPDCSPAAAEFRVDYQEIEGSDKLQYSEELTQALEFCGSGHVELSIPFPTPGYRYYLSWALLADGDEYLKTRKLTETIRNNAANFRGKALAELSDGLPANSIRVTLYGQTKENIPQLDRLSDDTEAPTHLNLFDARSRARSALFGDIQIITTESDTQNDLIDGESFLLFVPVTHSFADGGCHPALLRVATKAESGLKWPQDEPISPIVSNFVEKVYLAAVHIALSAQSL